MSPAEHVTIYQDACPAASPGHSDVATSQDRSAVGTVTVSQERDKPHGEALFKPERSCRSLLGV